MKYFNKLPAFLLCIVILSTNLSCSSDDSDIIVEEKVDNETPVAEKPKEKPPKNDDKPFVAEVIEQDVSVATLTGDWKKKTDIAGFTGDGYIVWEGEALFWKGEENIGKTGLLSFKINIEKPGTYKMQLRTYIAKKDPKKPNTEHNDTWVRVPDADNFFAQKQESIVYPKGSGKTPNPAGENGNGFFKSYMNLNDKWTYTSGTFDHNFHEIFATFNKAGKYTIEIAPRSNFHAIDGFKLTQQKP